MNLVTELHHQLFHSLINKDLLVKLLKIKQQLTQPELYMM
jgi:hypothetical protein